MTQTTIEHSPRCGPVVRTSRNTFLIRDCEPNEVQHWLPSSRYSTTDIGEQLQAEAAGHHRPKRSA